MAKHIALKRLCDRRTDKRIYGQKDKRTNGETNGKTNSRTNMMKKPISTKAEGQK